MIDNSGKSLEGEPIVLTKINVDAIEVPRDDFKVTTHINAGLPSHCMRYFEANGKSYAVTYWNCPTHDTSQLLPELGMLEVVFKCSECKLVTWIEVDV